MRTTQLSPAQPLNSTHLQEKMLPLKVTVKHICMDGEVGNAMVGGLIQADAEEASFLQLGLGALTHNARHGLQQTPGR